MRRIELLATVCGPSDPQIYYTRDSYLWGKLKTVVYPINPHDLEALEQNIRDAIYNIQQRELQQAF
jgi:hypothetical protein